MGYFWDTQVGTFWENDGDIFYVKKGEDDMPEFISILFWEEEEEDE